jgi:hypothetical protein
MTAMNDLVIWSALTDTANQLAKCICELFRGEAARILRSRGLRVEFADASIAGVRVRMSADSIVVASEDWSIRLPTDKQEELDVSLETLRRVVDCLWDACQWHVVTLAVDRAVA